MTPTELYIRTFLAAIHSMAEAVTPVPKAPSYSDEFHREVVKSASRLAETAVNFHLEASEEECDCGSCGEEEEDPEVDFADGMSEKELVSFAKTVLERAGYELEIEED
jgi:hypothetical protein